MIIETFLSKLLISLTGKIVISTASGAYKYRKTLYQRLLYQVIYRNRNIRISCATLLKLNSNNCDLLIKNRLRPNLYSPIGGAIRYYDSASSFLREIDFQQDENHSQINGEKLTRDMRGFIPAKNLFKFVDWYSKCTDREENSLNREINEEFAEIGLGKFNKYTENIELNF